MFFMPIQFFSVHFVDAEFLLKCNLIPIFFLDFGIDSNVVFSISASIGEKVNCGLLFKRLEAGFEISWHFSWDFYEILGKQHVSSMNQF